MLNIILYTIAVTKIRSNHFFFPYRLVVYWYINVSFITCYHIYLLYLYKINIYSYFYIDLEYKKNIYKNIYLGYLMYYNKYS